METYLISKYSNSSEVNNKYMDEICIKVLRVKTVRNPNVLRPISGNGSYLSLIHI